MKSLYITLMLTTLGSSLSVPTDLRIDFEEAILFLQEHQELCEQIAAEFPENELPYILSIVAPELIRYSLFKDFFETGALELAYVGGGPELADFSIGRFQMKPSFIEEIESQIVGSTELNERYGLLIGYPSGTEQMIRKARIQRMKRLDWQLRYANLYNLIVKECYSEYTDETISTHLAFRASAYNYGFMRPIREIQKHRHKATFPYGAKFETIQLPFGDWSLLFYTRLKKEFSPEKSSL